MKTYKRILCFFLILLLSVFVISCGKDDDNNNNDVEKGPWELDIYDCDGWDEDMKRNLPELIRIFNEHVPWGCCGKCLYF